MQIANAPAKIVLPFAENGAKNTIPVPSQVSITPAAASYDTGFPPLTMLPASGGGLPPFGEDMNGVLFAISALARWMNAGGGFVYDGTFAADADVLGYPEGARILRTDGLGYWLNTVDDNVTDPETSGSAAAGWVPDYTNGVAPVTMTSSNVTLTPLEYGLPIIVLSGTITTNLNLIFPAIAGRWIVINNCVGAFTITAKTASGAGVAVSAGGASTFIFCDGTDIKGIEGAVQATQLVSGIMKIATNAKITTGTDDTVAVSPLGLATNSISKKGKPAAQTVTDFTSVDYTFAHGLAVEPDSVTVKLRCLSADAGYTAGKALIIAASAISNEGMSLEIDSTNVIVRFPNGGFSLANGAGGGTTSLSAASKWELSIVALA